MARWKKTLAKMLNDPNPVGYTYDEAAQVLRHLGFDLAPVSGGSHRKWRREIHPGTVARVGLVEKGRGSMRDYLIRDMVAILRTYDLIPQDLENE